MRSVTSIERGNSTVQCGALHSSGEDSDQMWCQNCAISSALSRPSAAGNCILNLIDCDPFLTTSNLVVHGNVCNDEQALLSPVNAVERWLPLDGGGVLDAGDDGSPTTVAFQALFRISIAFQLYFLY